MNNTIFDATNAPEQSRPILEGVQQKLGFIPNLFGGLAVAPPVLQAYLDLSASYTASSLTPTEQHVVALAVSQVNGCDYCLAAHTTIAQGAGVDQTVLDAARDGSPLSPKLEVLRNFALRLRETQGHLDAGELDTFLAAGYTKAQAYEVIVGIALKVISNYSNRLLNTPLDQAFAANAVQKDSCSEQSACACPA